MSILVDKNTRVLVQGMGKAGLFHAQQCRDYGTTVVGGVSPGKVNILDAWGAVDQPGRETFLYLADYEQRIEFMVGTRVIEDYTYLWYDVRPHPNFGTVEVRVMDSQTHVEHTVGLAALVQALARELAVHFEEGKQLASYPFEMLDENKWLAARHGLEILAVN